MCKVGRGFSSRTEGVEEFSTQTQSMGVQVWWVVSFT